MVVSWKTDMLKAIFLLAFLAISVKADFSETIYTCTMTGGQVTPLQGDTSYEGTCVCVWDRMAPDNLKTIDCEVAHTIPTGADVLAFSNLPQQENITAGLYLGAAGLPGTLLYSFTTLNAPLRNVFRQTIQIVNLGLYTVEEQENDFLRGLWYLQINSLQFPGGNLRGQITHTDRVYSRMSHSFVVPPAQGSSSEGIAVGGYSERSPYQTISVTIVHNVQNPTAAYFGTAPATVKGSLQFKLNQFQAPIIESWTLTGVEQLALYNDATFLQVDSKQNSFGDIRGQIVTIDFPYPVGWVVRLDGDTAGTSASELGCALIAFDCRTKILEYMVIHNVFNATSATMTVNGNVIFDLSRGLSPIFGARQLRDIEEHYLYALSMRINVFDAFNNLIIAGDVNIDNQWWAYLTGTQVEPPVSTPYLGCGYFKLLDRGLHLQYNIMHNVPDIEVTELSLYVGYAGMTGRKIWKLNSAISPISGKDITFDDDELQHFVEGETYVQLRTTAYPLYGGELRGQLYRIAPCHPNGESFLTQPPESPSSGPSRGPASKDPFKNTTPPLVIILKDSAIALNASFVLMMLSLAFFLLAIQ